MGTQRYINTLASTHMRHETVDARSFVAIFRIRITSTLLKDHMTLCVKDDFKYNVQHMTHLAAHNSSEGEVYDVL